MLPVVMLSYPRSQNDPLFCLNGSLANKLAEHLSALGHSEFYISVPGDIDASATDELELGNWEFVYSKGAYPQQRLQELFARHSWDRAVVLSSYSQFIDIPSLEKCVAVSKEKELVVSASQSPPCSFWVMGKELVSKLDSFRETPITPFKFCDVARHILDDSQICTLTDCSKYGRYINILFGWVKDPCIGFPSFEFAKNYHEFCEKSGEPLFNENSILKYANHESDGHIDEESVLKASQSLDKIFPTSCRQDKNFSILGLLLRHQQLLPSPLENFLELGFGAYPLVSICLSQFAQHSYALEPSPYNKCHDDENEVIFDSLRQLTEHIPSSFKRKKLDDWSPSNLTVVNGYIEDLNIKDDSLQFCFSITVLEHVFPFEDLFEILFKKLKSGGSMLHLVDFKDHGKLTPFEFYKYSRDEWVAKQKHTNLLRICDMEAIFNKMGFSVSILDRVFVKSLPAKLHPFWNRYSAKDLTTGSCVFHLTKP